MKDFAKSVKVGNYDAQEKLGLKPVQGEIEKEVYSVYTQTGKDKEKTKKALKSKHPNLDEQWLDKLLSKLVGNESIDKQEWSMFQGLKKEAEKEIGNKAIVLKDGNVWVVLYANETKSQEFESEAEAREFAKKVGNETKAERKFGKVMGEFEEGALKTPQGKTVTDPAQAKAIAYSEADKVDNLKRARNAMKK